MMIADDVNVQKQHKNRNPKLSTSMTQHVLLLLLFHTSGTAPIDPSATHIRMTHRRQAEFLYWKQNIGWQTAQYRSALSDTSRLIKIKHRTMLADVIQMQRSKLLSSSELSSQYKLNGMANTADKKSMKAIAIT